MMYEAKTKKKSPKRLASESGEQTLSRGNVVWMAPAEDLASDHNLDKWQECAESANASHIYVIGIYSSL